MTLEGRAKGWLDERFHARFREILLHALCRSSTLCPIYCLMPDHGHFVVLGVSADADQKTWARMLRKEWNGLLGEGTSLARQAYDHVLRKEEREREALGKVAHYIRENPVRAGLVEDADAWLYAGCLVPGYPTLHPAKPLFWEAFWQAHEALLIPPHPPTP